MNGRVTDPAWVRQELARLGVTPRRFRGQHFLLDGTVVTDAVRAAELAPEQPVLEVGPGLGVLTGALLGTGAAVTAVEVEPQFARALVTRYRNRGTLTVISENLFAVNLAASFTDLGYAVVANLPYSVTGLALRNFLSIPPRPHRLVLLLQREVGQRLAFRPGEGSMLGLLAAATSTIELLREVPPVAFYPEPEVTSVLVRITLNPEPVEARLGVSLGVLLRVGRMGFAARRKTLSNNLSAALGRSRGSIDPMLDELGIQPTRRAQELTLPEWGKLAREIERKFVDAKGEK